MREDLYNADGCSIALARGREWSGESMATENSGKCGAGQSPWLLGVVSYLNARPLAFGLMHAARRRPGWWLGLGLVL